MSYSVTLITKERLQKYIDGEIVEEVYADTDTIGAGTTEPKKVVGGTIRSGYDAVIMGIAATQNDDVKAWIKIAEKQHYPDGLGTYGLGGVTNEETPLLIPVKERQSWELGFTNAGGADADIRWRIRIRLIKKE